MFVHTHKMYMYVCLCVTLEDQSILACWQVSYDRERGERISLERQLQGCSRELSELQSRYDALSSEWGSRSVGLVCDGGGGYDDNDNEDSGCGGDDEVVVSGQ